MHVHIRSADGEAKFWIEPMVEIEVHRGLSSKELKELKSVVEENVDEIRNHWHQHFNL